MKEELIKSKLDFLYKDAYKRKKSCIKDVAYNMSYSGKPITDDLSRLRYTKYTEEILKEFMLNENVDFVLKKLQELNIEFEKLSDKCYNNLFENLDNNLELKKINYYIRVFENLLKIFNLENAYIHLTKIEFSEEEIMACNRDENINKILI